MNKADEKSKSPSLKKMIRLGGYIRNPVLVQVVGICPVAAAATSVANAASLAAVFAVSLILCEIIASLFLKKLPRWVRVGIYSIIGAGVVFPFMYFIEKNETTLFANLGIYLPLMAMSSFNCVHCEKYAVSHSVKLSFFDALASSAGYAAVLLAVGFIREIIGTGGLFGYKLPFFSGLSGATMPFGGLIVIGLLAAAHKARVTKKYPRHAKDIETRFIVDESDDEQSTFTYAVKNRFKSGKKGGAV